jgi:hypothetical protein
MGRKRTKDEALARLEAKREELGDDAGKITRASFALAQGLVMLDPLNRLADDFITIPIPMIAIPAHESHLLSGSPTMQIYIRAGETIVPTGGNVQDFNEGVEQADALETLSNPPREPRTKSAYTKRYEKAFKALKPKYTLKNGKWKKNGFRACVKAAHAAARK